MSGELAGDDLALLLGFPAAQSWAKQAVIFQRILAGSPTGAAARLARSKLEISLEDQGPEPQICQTLGNSDILHVGEH